MKSIKLFLVLFLLLAPVGIGAQQYEPFAVISDTHIGAPNSIYPSFAAKMEQQKIGMVIHTGDAIDAPGKIKQWETFLKLTGENITLHLVPGNHDIKDRKSLAVYLKYFEKTYYSFAEGDTLFILLNTEFPGQEGRIAGDQLAWLKTELAKPFKYKFIFLHESLYPIIPLHGLDRHAEERDALHKLFVDHGVSLVVAGHDHMYSRSERDGITYIIAATLGGWLPSALKNGDSYRYMTATRKNGSYVFTVKNVEDSVKDQFNVKR